MSKENIILFVFLFIGALYLGWIVWKAMQQNFCGKVKEHFTSEEAVVDSEEVTHEEAYNARLSVIKVFDTVLHRKPTSAELETYSKIENEQDLLVKVLADFAVESEEKFVEDEQKSVSAVVKPEEAAVVKPIGHKTRILDNLAQITAAVEEIKKTLN